MGWSVGWISVPTERSTSNATHPPCNLALCDEAVSCHNANCGECKAVFYDAAGNHVCKTEPVGLSGGGNDTLPKTCANDSD